MKEKKKRGKKVWLRSVLVIEIEKSFSLSLTACFALHVTETENKERYTRGNCTHMPNATMCSAMSRVDEE
jgi:hypothetical protein